MAKILSHVWSTVRGSVGGITYLANPFHQIIARQRTSPVNPQTTFQSMVRGAFSDASVLFEALSDADRLLWNEYADTLIYQGPLGPYSLPARQVAMSNVGFASYLTDRGIDVGSVDCSPPIVPGFLALSDLDVGAPVAAGTGFSISLRNAQAVDVIVAIERSHAFPPTRYRFKGPFLSSSLIGATVPSTSVCVQDILNLNLGSIYFASVRAITDEPPYRISTKYIVRAVAQTTVV